MVETTRRELLAQYAKDPAEGPNGDLVNQTKRKMEVKKAGDAKWMAEVSPAARTVMTVSSPDGGPAVPFGPESDCRNDG